MPPPFSNVQKSRQVDPRARLNSWLERPLSVWWCAFGWCAATALFVGIVAVLGGPSIVDRPESIYGTWAVAHGQFACAYPSVSLQQGGRLPAYPTVAPLYLLLSGGITAIAHVGQGVPFPTAAMLGPGCDKSFLAMNPWSVNAGAVGPTAWIGCVGWVALVIGVVAWLRASGRGRCGWEPATLVMVVCLTPVWTCVQLNFHPQDLLALGMALCAMACARRGRWIGAGILIAMAILSQQFALLVAAPLLVLAPAKRRISYVGAALATAALVVLPFLISTGGRALRAVTLGTGNSPSSGGTLLWELHLSGAPLVLLSRVTPILVSVALSLWVLRRVGHEALEPRTLMAVVAVSLGLRLVFEQNLFAYYFMALAVSLVLLDVVRGHLRNSTLAWLAAVGLEFCLSPSQGFQPVSWAGSIQRVFPLLVLTPVLLVLLLRIHRGRSIRNLWPWLAVAACALLAWPGQADAPLHQPVRWLWQVALVVPGLVLAARPLLADMQLDETEPTMRRIETVPMIEL